MDYRSQIKEKMGKLLFLEMNIEGFKESIGIPKYVKFKNIPFAMEELLFDPQTSGGLLFAVKPEQAGAFLKELQGAGLPAAMVGRFVSKKERDIYVR